MRYPKAAIGLDEAVRLIRGAGASESEARAFILDAMTAGELPHIRHWDGWRHRERPDLTDVDTVDWVQSIVRCGGHQAMVLVLRDAVVALIRTAGRVKEVEPEPVVAPPNKKLVVVQAAKGVISTA